MIKNLILFVVVLFLGCSEARRFDEQLANIKNHQTFECSIEENNIAYELRHGFTADEIITSIEGCKKAKYKRGDLLAIKSNSNCTFKTYFHVVLDPYMAKGINAKIGTVVYRGEENCNGLVNEMHSELETNLLLKKPIPFKESCLRCFSYKLPYKACGVSDNKCKRFVKTKVE